MKIRMLTASRRVMAIATTTVILTGVAACGGETAKSGDASGGASAAEPVRLRISATLIDTLPFMAALKMADDRGYYEEEGLEVEFASASGGGSTLRSLSTGDADMAIGAPGASVLATQEDVNLRIISLWAPANGFYWIGPSEVNDLEGQPIGGAGPGSTVNLLLAGIEEETGTDLGEVIPAGGMGENWAAAKSGSVVAGWAMEPFVTQQIEKEDAAIVIDAPEVFPWFPADMVVVTQEFMDANPEALEAFFRAAQRVFDDFANDQAGVAKELSAIMGIDAEIIEQSLTDPAVASEDLYSFRTVPEALETVSDLMQVAGQITEPVDWDAIFDQQFLPEDARASF
jgi:NitT/TauT family transport system substrate-binding protein